MDENRIAHNLACVEKHFHSEAENEVAAALELYTDDIVWEAPALNGLNRSYSGKDEVAKNLSTNSSTKRAPSRVAAS